MDHSFSQKNTSACKCRLYIERISLQTPGALNFPNVKKKKRESSPEVRESSVLSLFRVDGKAVRRRYMFSPTDRARAACARANNRSSTFRGAERGQGGGVRRGRGNLEAAARLLIFASFIYIRGSKERERKRERR